MYIDYTLPLVTSHKLVLIKRKTTEPYVLTIILATSILLTYKFDSADQIFDSEFL